MSIFGSESSASAPSKINDSRAVAYDEGLNASGNKNKIWSNRDQASQFAGAGTSNISGDGNSTSFNVLDGGAIAGAFDLAKVALQMGADSSIASGELYSGYGQQLQNFVADQAADPGDSMTLTKWVIGGVLVLGVVYLFRKGKKA